MAVTANAMREDILQCRNAGMDDHLAKPVSRDEMLAMVERWALRH